jgi:hypothetical protein
MLTSAFKRLHSTARIRNIILLVKDTSISAKFYNEAIGLPIRSQTETMAELDAGGTLIVLKVIKLEVSFLYFALLESPKPNSVEFRNLIESFH